MKRFFHSLVSRQEKASFICRLAAIIHTDHLPSRKVETSSTGSRSSVRQHQILISPVLPSRPRDDRHLAGDFSPPAYLHLPAHTLRLQYFHAHDRPATQEFVSHRLTRPYVHSRSCGSHTKVSCRNGAKNKLNRPNVEDKSCPSFDFTSQSGHHR